MRRSPPSAISAPVTETKTKTETKTETSDPTRRRILLTGAAAALGTLAAPWVHAQGTPKVRIGYWPVAAGLPFFAAIEKGYFKEAGLDVAPLRFAGAQQVMEAMLSGRGDGSANGVGTANLGIGAIAQPGLFKIFCTNPSNVKNVLEEFLVPKASTVSSAAGLAGKKVACGPGIQNVTLARTMLERAGAKGANVIELPIAQHVAAIAAGQVDGCYTLEPTGTVGRLNGTTRTLEAGVVSHYILGDPMAPWHGGAATLTSDFIRKNPAAATRFIAAYRRGVTFVREQPDDARQYLKGYTAIEGPLTREVPLAAYMMYDEFKPSDADYFQKFYDLFTDRKVFSQKVDVRPLLYRA